MHVIGHDSDVDPWQSFGIDEDVDPDDPLVVEGERHDRVGLPLSVDYPAGAAVHDRGSGIERRIGQPAEEDRLVRHRLRALRDSARDRWRVAVVGTEHDSGGEDREQAVEIAVPRGGEKDGDHLALAIQGVA